MKTASLKWKAWHLDSFYKCNILSKWSGDGVTVTFFLSIVCFPSPLPPFLIVHLCAICVSSTNLSPNLFSSLTSSFYYCPYPSSFFALCPHLCHFNSVTVNHMSNPDTLFLSSTTPQGNTRWLCPKATQCQERAQQTGQRTHKWPPWKEADCISVNKAT